MLSGHVNDGLLYLRFDFMAWGLELVFSDLRRASTFSAKAATGNRRLPYTLLAKYTTILTKVVFSWAQIIYVGFRLSHLLPSSVHSELTA